MSIRNTLLTLLFGGTLGGFLMREQERGTLEPFDRVHREFLKANPSPDEPATALEEPAVVFARMDDRDQLNRVFSSWPLDSSDWEVILGNLPDYKPKAIAITAPLPFLKAGSGLTAAAGKLSLLSSAAPASAAPGDGVAQLPEGLPPITVSGSALKIPEFKSIRPPAMPGAWAAGDIDMIPAAQKLTVDGDWCRVPMLARMGDRVIPTMALRALLDWSGIPMKDVTVQPGVAIIAGKSLRIPVDEAGFFRYYLSLAPEVPSVNADVFVLTRDRALTDLLQNDPQRRILETLNTRLLWFGEDDTAARRLKLPNGTPVSPASLTARAIAAIQTARFMRPLPPAFQWIPAGTTLLFCLWLTHWRKSRLWPGALLAAVALIAVSLYLYRHSHHWMPLGPSLGLLGATVVLSYILPTPGSRPQPEPDPPVTAKSRRPPPANEPVREAAALQPPSGRDTATFPDSFSQPDVIVEPDVLETTAAPQEPEAMENPVESEPSPVMEEPEAMEDTVRELESPPGEEPPGIQEAVGAHPQSSPARNRKGKKKKRK